MTRYKCSTGTVKLALLAKYLVIKFTRFSKPVQKQQQMRAQHDVVVENLAAQTPTYKIQC